MMSAMIPLLVFLFLCGVAGLTVFSRNLKSFGALNRPSSSIPPTHSITIVIPARNEALRIPKLLKSIQNSQVEVLVVDDASSDGTISVAEDAGARVVRSQPLPEGWRGKPWVCFQGAQHAQGDWLLFLDADTELASAWQDSLLGCLKEIPNLDLHKSFAISWLPYHRLEKPYEQLSAVFQLTMAMGSGAFAFKAKTNLFGQALLVPRKEFLEVGAHSLVKQEVLENFVLSDLLRERNWQIYSVLGNGLISMRMFPTGLKDLWLGWRKAFQSGTSHTKPGLLFLISLWITGAMSVIFLPWIFPLSFGFWMFFYFIFSLQMMFFLKKLGSYSLFTALFFPIPLLFYQSVFLDHLLFKKRSLLWKGRGV
jgi:4,4'-diaponeurosporenoate glycosyltransferase